MLQPFILIMPGPIYSVQTKQLPISPAHKTSLLGYVANK